MSLLQISVSFAGLLQFLAKRLRNLHFLAVAFTKLKFCKSLLLPLIPPKDRGLHDGLHLPDF
jgi:hypothetical protein